MMCISVCAQHAYIWLTVCKVLSPTDWCSAWQTLGAQLLGVADALVVPDIMQQPPSRILSCCSSTMSCCGFCCVLKVSAAGARVLCHVAQEPVKLYQKHQPNNTRGINHCNMLQHYFSENGRLSAVTTRVHMCMWSCIPRQKQLGPIITCCNGS